MTDKQMKHTAEANSVWITGYEGRYKIYADGRVESFCKRPYRFISHCPSDRKGYPTIHLFSKNRRRRFKIHSIVAKHFVPGYAPGLQVNHKNCIKTDNRAENLEWVTMLENIAHAKKHRLLGRGAKRRKPVVGTSMDTGQELRFESGVEAARHVNGFSTCISKCCLGKERSHKGFKWRYA